MPTTWANLISGNTICKFSDIEKKFKSLGIVLPNKGSGQNALYNDAYAEVGGWIRRRLIADLRRRKPDAPNKWYTAAIGRYKQRLEQISYAERAASVGCLCVSDGLWYDSFDNLTSPVLWTNDGIPTSSTKANEAETGDYLLNVNNRNGFLYINRGTKTVPNWQRFLTDDLVDYIHNPTELKDAFVHGILFNIAQRNEKPGDVAAYEWSEIKMKLADRGEEDYEKHLAIALSILTYDEDGDGIASNYELEQIDTKGFFLGC